MKNLILLFLFSKVKNTIQNATLSSLLIFINSYIIDFFPNSKPYLIQQLIFYRGDSTGKATDDVLRGNLHHLYCEHNVKVWLPGTTPGMG